MNHFQPRRLSRPDVLALSAFLLLSGGCSDRQRSPLDPLDGLPPIVLPPAQEVEAFVPPITDANDRVLPTVGDAVLRKNLGTELAVLEKALSEGNAREGARRVINAQKLLDYRLRPESFDEGPELSAIELVLDRARVMLGLPEAK